MLPPLAGITIQYMRPEARSVWLWVVEIAQAVGPLALVVITIYLATIYKKQTTAMKAQQQASEKMAVLMQQEEQILFEQYDTQRRLAIFSYAPFLAPDWPVEQTSLWLHRDTPWKNYGRGPAFDLEVGVWPTATGKHITRSVTRDRRSVPPGDQVMLLLSDEQLGECREDAVLVLHYQDFFGELWHTTWNLNRRGEFEQMTSPRVWNPGTWVELGLDSDLWQFCEHCKPFADKWRADAAKPTTPLT